MIGHSSSPEERTNLQDVDFPSAHQQLSLTIRRRLRTTTALRAITCQFTFHARLRTLWVPLSLRSRLDSSPSEGVPRTSVPSPSPFGASAVSCNEIVSLSRLNVQPRPTSAKRTRSRLSERIIRHKAAFETSFCLLRLYRYQLQSRRDGGVQGQP